MAKNDDACREPRAMDRTRISLMGRHRASDAHLRGRARRYPHFWFEATVREGANANGLAGGRITALRLNRDDDEAGASEVMAEFDKGWRTPPKTADAWKAVKEIDRGFPCAQRDRVMAQKRGQETLKKSDGLEAQRPSRETLHLPAWKPKGARAPHTPKPHVEPSRDR